MTDEDLKYILSEGVSHIMENLSFTEGNIHSKEEREKIVKKIQKLTEKFNEPWDPYVPHLCSSVSFNTGENSLITKEGKISEKTLLTSINISKSFFPPNTSTSFSVDYTYLHKPNLKRMRKRKLKQLFK